MNCKATSKFQKSPVRLTDQQMLHVWCQNDEKNIEYIIVFIVSQCPPLNSSTEEKSHLTKSFIRKRSPLYSWSWLSENEAAVPSLDVMGRRTRMSKQGFKFLERTSCRLLLFLIAASFSRRVYNGDRFLGGALQTVENRILCKVPLMTDSELWWKRKGTTI